MYNIFLPIHIVFLFILISGNEGTVPIEGKPCEVNGNLGVCLNIAECPSAQQKLWKGREVVTCDYDAEEPIVCCLEDPSQKNIYDNPVEGTEGPDNCPAISTHLTTEKIGQRAWDKCADYQEKLVYPCEVSLTPEGSKIRVNNCLHYTNQFLHGAPDAKVNEFTHTVLLGYASRDDRSIIKWWCVGSIISERFVITVQYCARNKAAGDVAYVLVGAYRRNDTSDLSKVYNVKRIIQHPEYESSTIYNDIVLLELEREIPLSRYVVPACLHVGDPIEDARVVGTGWGRHTNYGELSKVLKKVVLDKVSSNDCALNYPEDGELPKGVDEEIQVCYAAHKAGEDMCKGDGGAPIQIESAKFHCMYEIIGLTSVGKACGKVEEPGLYTKVAPYVPWIESIVWP